MLRAVIVTLLAGLALAFASASPARASGPDVLVGVSEDTFKTPDLVRAKTRMTLARLAGFSALRLTTLWYPGTSSARPTEKRLLKNAIAAAQLNGIEVYLAFTQFGSNTTPKDEEQRQQFAEWVASYARAFRSVRNFIIGNEPNLNRFWLPQFNPDGTDAAAPAYLDLLARSYDAVKAVAPRVTVIGGAVSPRGADNPLAERQTHSPTQFILDLGNAYAESGRTKPVMDAFAMHPYQDNSSQRPTFTHGGSKTITIGDYGKLVRLLGRAFDGTPQPGSTLPIVYAEYGIQSRIPTAKAGKYKEAEQPSTKPVAEATQGRFYRDALKLAFCQPNVKALLLFLAFDEVDLRGWQSGVYYSDRTPKPSLGAVRAAIDASRRGVVGRCRGLQLVPKATLHFAKPPVKAGKPVGFRLACDIDCRYNARLERLPAGRTVQRAAGWAKGGAEQAVQFPKRKLAPGRYRIGVQLVAPLNPGPPVLTGSKPFALTAPG